MDSPASKPVILLAFANDRTRDLAGLSREISQLRALLDALDRAGRCRLILLPYTSVNEILDAFQEYRDRIAIFHFSGQANHYQLLQESATELPAPADAGGLAAFIAQQRQLQLVFLKGCATQKQADDLHTAGVRVVIATDPALDDAVATDFAVRFYGGIANDATIGTAFAEAGMQTQHGSRQRHLLVHPSEQAQADPNRWPWALYERSDAEVSVAWRLPPQAGEARLWVGVPARPNPDHIVGRQALLDNLVTRLREGQSPALAINGLPGVGKSTLAILVAHDQRIRNHFTDGVLWAGLGPTPDVPSVQAAWAEALELDLSEVTDPRKRQERLSATIGQRRLLVVIDDAWQVEAAQRLRLSGPNVAHLLTTRNTTIAGGFAGVAQTLTVPVLDDETAWQLLQQLAPEACDADAVAARALVDAVGGLPLAIELLGGYLAAPEQNTLQDLSQAAIADGLQPLEAVMQLNLDDLAGVDAAAVETFTALGAFAPKPATFEVAAAEAVTGAPPKVLALLVARNLLEVGPEGAMAMHQVVHDAAQKKVPEAATVRHRTYYLGEVDQDRENWSHIKELYGQLKHAWASAQPLNLETALSFVYALRIYQERRGLWHDELAWTEAALGLAQAAGNAAETGTLLNNIGFIYSALGEKNKALDFFNQALPLRQQVGDIGGEATTLNNIGRAYSDLGANDKALDFYNQALPLRQRAGDIGGEAITTLRLLLVHLDQSNETITVESTLKLMRAFDSLYEQLDRRVATALGLDPWAKQIKATLQQISSDDSELPNT